MDFTVVVNSARYLAPLGTGASHLVRHDGARVLLDAANGTALRLARHLDGGGLDAIVVSHFHLDTVADLLPVLLALDRPTPVIVPERARARLSEILAGLSRRRAPPNARLEGVGNGSVASVGTLSLSFAKTYHGCPGVGVRVDAGGRSLTYLPDTGHRPWLPALARATDLLVVPTLLLDAEAGGERGQRNLSAGAAGRLAEAAGARRLGLVHVPFYADAEDSLAEARAFFSGNVTLLREGQSYDV